MIIDGVEYVRAIDACNATIGFRDQLRMLVETFPVPTAMITVILVLLGGIIAFVLLTMPYRGSG